MSEVTLPPIVNDQGNINVHVGEGCKIPIEMQSDSGTETDASAIPLFFVSGSFRKALAADPNDALGRMLVLTPSDLTSIPHGSDFRVVDESDPSLPINRWEGRIYKRG